jgi:hypothetical protein
VIEETPEPAGLPEVMAGMIAAGHINLGSHHSVLLEPVKNRVHEGVSYPPTSMLLVYVQAADVSVLGDGEGLVLRHRAHHIPPQRRTDLVLSDQDAGPSSAKRRLQLPPEPFSVVPSRHQAAVQMAQEVTRTPLQPDNLP